MAELLRFDAATVSLRAAQADEDPNKGIRCTLVGYSGGEMNVAGYGPIVVDVSGVKADAQTPLLSDHDSSLDGLIGFATVSAADNKITASGLIVPQTAAAQQIVAMAKAGFQFQASMGLEPETQEQIKPDTLVSVNGRQIRSGPRGLTLVRAGTLKEISVLPLGADSTTSVNVAARNQGSEHMSTATITDPQEILRAERERVAAIEQAVSPFLAGDVSGQVAGIRAKALAGELDLPAVNANLLGILRTSRATNASTASPGMFARHDNPKDILAAAILIRAGEETAGEKGFGAGVMQRARDMRLTSLVDVFKAAWIMDGREPPSSTNELITAAATPISLPSILSNAMHKVLLESYQMFPSAARMIAKKLTAQDFKQHSEMRLVGDIMMKPLNTSGEIQHAQLGEQAYTWQVDTFARIIKIDRKLLINDDLSAFSSIPKMFGRGAALAVEDKFWNLVLTNTGSFFAAGNSNYLSGVTVGTNDSRLNVEGLSRAYSQLMKQVDPAGYPVNIMPRFVLVPPELKSTGDSLYRSNNLVASPTAAAGTPTIASTNPFLGLGEPIVSPYLSNTSYSGYSTTGWYLFGGPEDIAAFGIGYLSGQEAPIVEQAPQEAEHLGLTFRAWLDFGVTQLDSRGAVFSAGA